MKSVQLLAVKVQFRGNKLMKIVFKFFPRYVLVYAHNLQGNKYVISVFEFFSLTYFLLIRIKAFFPPLLCPIWIAV